MELTDHHELLALLLRARACLLVPSKQDISLDQAKALIQHAHGLVSEAAEVLQRTNRQAIDMNSPVSWRRQHLEPRERRGSKNYGKTANAEKADIA